MTTKQEKLLESFPNVAKDPKGVVILEPCAIEPERTCPTDFGVSCRECRTRYWQEEIEQEQGQ